jgi:hypothetical protein
MAGWSDGYRADLVRRQLTPGLISLLPGTAGLPPSISFSTSYPELDSAETTLAAIGFELRRLRCVCTILSSIDSLGGSDP